MTIVSLAVTIYRKPLACLRRPRMRYWRNRPDAQRLYERSLLLGGIGLGAFSVIVLFLHLIVIPRLQRTLTQIRVRYCGTSAPDGVRGSDLRVGSSFGDLGKRLM